MPRHNSGKDTDSHRKSTDEDGLRGDMNDGFNSEYTKYTKCNSRGDGDSIPSVGRSDDMPTRPLVLVLGDVAKDFGADGVATLDDLIEEAVEAGSTHDSETEETDHEPDGGTGVETPTSDGSESIIDFTNPSPIDPAETAEFCGRLDLEREVGLMRDAYTNPSKHFTYPIDAMLRLVPFQRLKQIKHKKTLASKVDYGENATALGFEGKNPNRRTIGHFYNKRLTKPRLRACRESLLNRLEDALAEHDITLGHRIGVDSTPLETLQSDEIGSINKHYFQKYGIGEMVKIHFVTCINTGVPLAFRVTDGTAYDGHHLMSLLRKLDALGIDFKEIYADSHYGTFKNWARVSVGYGATAYFDLEKNAVERDDGTEEHIEQTYRDLVENGSGIMPEHLSFDEMCRALIRRGEYEPVGAYFRNEWWRVRRNDEQRYSRIYHRRNASENLHSILKDQLLMDKNLNVKGYDAIEKYVEQFMLTLTYVALTRVGNGVTEGLTRVNPTAFN